MLIRLAFATLATMLLISPLEAQMRAAAPSGGRAARGVVRGSPHLRQGHRRSLPWSYPYFDSDYDYDYDFEQNSLPQIVAAPVSAPEPAPSAPPLEPLLIEWQGDHFVRMTLSQKAATEGQTGPDYSEKRAHLTPASGRKDVAQQPRELPPAVLVFRDGRTEELSSYTIMSGMIYSKTDYWSSGSWSRKIQIADLDVAATLNRNQERGLRFLLPSSPNEVVMRP